MIQRFNFYDIYGYFIPGLAVVVLLWLPYAVLSQRWPDAQLAVAALGLAYAVGHVVQSMAANSFSAKLDRDEQGKAAYPSSVVLDQNDQRLDGELKRRIQANVGAWFDIDVAVDSAIDDQARKAILKRRQTAFSLCRPIVNARSAYAEQFEGLYVMMRGLCVAFGLCASYMAGWALASRKPSPSMTVVIGICVVVLFAASLARAFDSFGTKYREPIDRLLLAILAVAFLGAGYVVAGAWRPALATDTRLVFGACVFVYLAIALRFLILYRYFAREFAKAVWTSFAVEPTKRPEKA
jgi:hypothetical protein